MIKDRKITDIRILSETDEEKKENQTKKMKSIID